MGEKEKVGVRGCISRSAMARRPLKEEEGDIKSAAAAEGGGGESAMAAVRRQACYVKKIGRAHV